MCGRGLKEFKVVISFLWKVPRWPWVEGPVWQQEDGQKKRTKDDTRSEIFNRRSGRGGGGTKKASWSAPLHQSANSWPVTNAMR